MPVTLLKVSQASKQTDDVIALFFFNHQLLVHELEFLS